MFKPLVRALFAIWVTGALSPAQATPPPPPSGDVKIFGEPKVWSVHLTFAADQWAAMQPVQGPRPARRPGGSFLQGPDGGRNGIAAAFGIQFNYVRAELEWGTQRMADVAVRYKGNGTFLSAREALKKSMKLDLTSS